jgi:hypothetical protein
MLIGADDASTGDRGKLHVTVHHNWWSTLAVERMPSVRYGRVHVFDNYYNTPGNNYNIRSRIEAEVLIQNNSFENVDDPYVIYVTTGITGKIHASGNQFVNTTGTIDDGNDTVFTPPYAYALDSAASVKSIVSAGAGAGKLSTSTDSMPPTSHVNALPSSTSTNPFTVTWSGSDTGGSGLANFDVYVSDNNASYTLWKNATTTTSGAFTGTFGHTYRFYSRARDVAGNLEAAPPSSDATTTLVHAPSNWWRLDSTSGTTAIDSVGGVNGTLVNFESTDWTSAGHTGGALALDGVNERINLGATLNVTNNFTIAGWIKPSRSHRVAGAVRKDHGRQQQAVPADAQQRVAQLPVRAQREQLEPQRRNDPGGCVATRGRHGRQRAEGDALREWPGRHERYRARRDAGEQRRGERGRWGGNYNSRYYAGLLDDMRFYTTALTAAEIAQLAV